ncbi:toll/interleukin-1 receptor domain-containing protein [Phenylobacterium sp. J367]|uniref:toll/interleukin-1 receptor domain-containing protein n=1 Tax=Phenylobacterium sp. J367 TaxID=2898435 RepID=UPI00215124D8|nr:toll/interleukin-1 receptor domain-containing protein [Phenylobacterium sp. J367]MCR5879192.1 toll/interleukin-1 receptor domain-containing protein [Phenylobacterium sp. J367]
MEGEAPAAQRYRAFISYSHRDAAFGRRLHRRLEGYRLPRRLAGRATPRGPAPARLSPIFRDREELSAAHDLTAEVRQALAQSGALIVVCSPNAAGSPWVAREVELFRELHPDRPILAALIDGEPSQAFCPPLRAGGAEPLAADFRPGQDGARLALLKLVAGVAGVGLDELVQRDAQRRLRGVMAVTGGALAATLAMGVLTAIALDARRDAERQRAEAEALVEFMLTDLRDRLEGVGRLDVLTAVNRQALDYYAGQDLDRLPASSLERRARLLHAMGEDDEKRGDLDRARGQFEEARRTTAALLAARPDDPERIFAHAQSEYWVGYMDYRRGRMGPAKTSWESYRRLAEQLTRTAPDNAKWRRELGYAEGNLCTLALESRPSPAVADAVDRCGRALAAMEAVAAATPGDAGVALDLANRHAWLADAYRASGDYARARAERQRQEVILAGLIQADPRSLLLKEKWVTLQRAYAGLAWVQRDMPETRRRMTAARATVLEMIAFDPENQTWVELRDGIDASVRTMNIIDKGA